MIRSSVVTSQTPAIYSLLMYTASWFSPNCRVALIFSGVYLYRYLYWSVWGSQPKIERAYLDGSHRSVFVGSQLVQPTGIALDLPAGLLFWADMKANRIEGITFNGTHRTVIVDYLKDDFRNPFMLTVFEDLIYCTTLNTGLVFSVHKFGQGTVQKVIGNLYRPSDIKMVQEQQQVKGTFFQLMVVCQCGNVDVFESLQLDSRGDGWWRKRLSQGNGNLR